MLAGRLRGPPPPAVKSPPWGLISLGLLYFGLTRRSRALRLARFGLFGVTLVKIFFYDLAFLRKSLEPHFRILSVTEEVRLYQNALLLQRTT